MLNKQMIWQTNTIHLRKSPILEKQNEKNILNIDINKNKIIKVTPCSE